jgi:hypothetical protein
MGGRNRASFRDGRDLGVAPGMSSEREESTMDEASMDFTMDELREFLEADNLDVPIDPAFKEALRRRLWEMVLRQQRPRSLSEG